MYSREEILEAYLMQAINTIEFLHGCLTEPDTYSYGYPDQTERRLEEMKSIVPPETICFHSRVDRECEGCMEGVRHRQIYAQVRGTGNV